MASKIGDVSSSTKFNWTIENFSKLNAEKGHDSDVFSVGPFKWTVRICPKGQGGGVYDHLTLGLMPIRLMKSVKVAFSFAVTSQTDPYNTKKLEYKLEFPEKCGGCGWERFMRLSELHDPNKGYLLNDTCVIRVEVTCWMKYEDSKDDENLSEGNAMEGNKKDDEDEGTESDEDKKDDVDEDDATCKNQNQVVKTDIASTQSIRYPGAGQPFEEGQHYNKVGFCEDNHEYEDVGGFSILKTQAPLYKQIWLKYGHIPSAKVMALIVSYPILVMVVKDLMCSITEMHACHYVDLSSDMIERWEGMLKMAEKFEFNIGWLRERFEHIKKGMGKMQNFKTELLEHGQQLRATKSNMRVIRNVLTNIDLQLIAEKDVVREKISGLLSKSDTETYLEIGEDLLLDGLLVDRMY